MKNHYKRISRRLILSILILISCVFLTSLCVAPEEGREPVPEASAGPATPEMPQEPEVPEEALLLMATPHFTMEEYRCDIDIEIIKYQTR